MTIVLEMTVLVTKRPMVRRVTVGVAVPRPVRRTPELGMSANIEVRLYAAWRPSHGDERVVPAPVRHRLPAVCTHRRLIRLFLESGSSTIDR